MKDFTIDSISELEIRHIEKLDVHHEAVKLWDLTHDNSCGTYAQLSFGDGSFSLLMAKGVQGIPSVIEFHNIGIMDNKTIYYALTDGDKKPFGIWTRELNQTKLIFKRMY